MWNPEQDQTYGWAKDGEDYDFITWTAPKAHVQKVEIQFRDDQHAQIADLEIYYCDSGSYVCQDFLRVTSSADTSLCGQNQNEDASDWAGSEIQVYFLHVECGLLDVGDNLPWSWILMLVTFRDVNAQLNIWA